MATYLVLNLLFLVVVLGALAAARSLVLSKLVLVTLIILIVFTIVFDSFIILAGIVEYDWSKLLGIKIGTAPIEDFFYAFLAAVMIPGLWKLFERQGSES
jgi:lycopene cyclase domain-containing protein